MKKPLISGMVFLLMISFSIFAAEKTLKLALDADPVSMDLQVQLSGGMLALSHWVADPLVRYRQDMSFEPRIAEKYERINDLTMRFYLRKNVKFHSGNIMTAKDIKFTMDRFNSSKDFKGLFDPFDETVIVDDYTVDIKTKNPYPLLINMATYIFPLDSKFYSGFDDKGQAKDYVIKEGYSFANETFPSTTGPFKVIEREQGVKLVLERNKNYWDTSSKGNIDKIVIETIQEDATRIAALLSGAIDFIYPVPPQDFPRIKKNRKLELVTFTGGRIITVQMNQKRLKPLANVKVRQAIVYATNNVGISKKIMKGTASPAAQMSPKGYVAHSPELKPRYDLAKAKKLMKEAGYEKGFEATMIAPNNRYVNDEKIAEAFVAMVSKIGIKISLKTMPKALYWNEFDKRVADFQLIGWRSDTEDSGNFFEFLAMCPNPETGLGQFNSGNYCNEEVDKLTLAAQSETDITKRNEMLKKVEKILYDEAAHVPFHWQNHSYSAKKGIDVYPIVNSQNFPYLGDLVMK